MDFGNLFFSLDGRINRAKFWLGIVILLVAQVILMMVAGLVFGSSMMGEMDPNQPPSLAALLPMIIIILLIFWPSICLYAKRWHDRDKSYARKLVTERSGGALGLFYPVLEQHSLDDLHELV